METRFHFLYQDTTHVLRNSVHQQLTSLLTCKVHALKEDPLISAKMLSILIAKERRPISPGINIKMMPPAEVKAEVEFLQFKPTYQEIGCNLSGEARWLNVNP